MFTNLNQIPGMAPRHAENADTRQEIKRHDPDQEWRKQEEKENDIQNPFDGEDHAVVTISALRVFLENFLKSLEAQTTSPSVAQNQAEMFVPEAPQKPAADTAASKAARAYQSTARVTEGPRFDNQAGAETQSILGGEDIRTIHVLLKDLADLAGRNVEFLQIEKNESFLQSLVAAVDKLKV